MICENASGFLDFFNIFAEKRFFLLEQRGQVHFNSLYPSLMRDLYTLARNACHEVTIFHMRFCASLRSVFIS